MKRINIIWIIGIVLAVLFLWGLIGSSIASDIGITCDVGLGKDGGVFCWTWHKNIFGDIGDAISQAIGK